MHANVDDWNRAAEHVCQDVLSACGYEAGVVDALQLARKLGYSVIFDELQATRGRLKRIGHKTSIFLKPDTRPERIQWALSHEIGESLAYRVFQTLELAPPSESMGLREQVANLLATRLLLPSRDFLSTALHCHSDIQALKRIYWTASHELIALRLLDLPRRACVTIVDQGRVTKRRASTPSQPGPWTTLEQNCWQETHRGARFQESCSEQLHIRCWPIHEPHWKREILLTTLPLSWETEPGYD